MALHSALPAVMRADLKMWSIVLLAALAMCMRGLHAGTVLTADGALHEGELSIDHGIVVRGSPTAVKVPISAILRARFATPDPTLQPGLLLVNGGRIAGKFSPLSGATVKIEAKRITIPAKEIAWVIYQPVTTALAAQTPRGKTGALLDGGDFFEGTPRGSDATGAKVLSGIFGPRMFAPWELRALVLREVQPQPAAFDVLTRDGSIYPALDIVAGDGAEVTLRHPFYNGLRVPLAEIVEIRASATRLLPLDGIKPTRVDPAPSRDAATCFAANRALDGGALKLGSRTVAAGFECATGATVWWKPPPGAGTFFALVAAGAGTPAGEKLTFTVYADGKLAGRSAPLTAGDPPAVLRCAVPGRESLTLRIDGAGGTGVWAEPMLLRR
ncbi:MAG: NPCBM/NEW2 domain-containing protein [Chthoniobacteraceae bacterium]